MHMAVCIFIGRTRTVIGWPMGGSATQCDRSWRIQEHAFPAVWIRSRYIVPAEVVENLAKQAIETGACVDVAKVAAEASRLLAELKRPDRGWDAVVVGEGTRCWFGN